MSSKHVLLRNPRLKGWEYGMLRAFEDEIVQQTGATVINIPHYGSSGLVKKAGHGMRLEYGRKVFPKKSLKIEAEVIWCILMGPENYELDLFKDWGTVAKHRILYLYDTLQPQFTLIKKLFSNESFNIRITSFHDAVADLEKLTNNKWHAVEQAVPASLFVPVSASEKIIDFSSYGRRFPAFHAALLEFCLANNLYYDYTTHDGRHPVAPEDELYRQYAWHLAHSKFTVSWPVELTSPERAGRLHPITCRWFEAASSATAIIGRQPGNALFDKLLDKNLVLEVDPFESKQAIWKKLESLYSDRVLLLQQAADIQSNNINRWTWNDRVKRILAIIDQ